MDTRKMLEPIIKSFSIEIQKLLDNQEGLNKNLALSIEKVKEDEKGLRIQKIENNNILDKQKDKLNEDRVIQVGLNNQIKDELAKYSKLSIEYENKLKDIEQNFKDSEVQKELVSQALCRAKDKENTYKRKTELLRTDVANNEDVKKELAQMKKNSLSKQRVLDKQEADLLDRTSKLNKLNLSLRIREKEVKRLVTKYELEKFIKEN